MKLLIVDQTGSALDWAMRCQADGHVVKWYLRERQGSEASGASSTHIGDGLVEKVRDYRPWLVWADLVFVTDNTYYVEELDHAHNRGIPVFGPSTLGAELELDRQFGQDFLAKHGIPVIPGSRFTSYDDAIDYVKKTMGRYVSKPCGDADKAMSYVSKSPEDMVFMLQRWRRNKTLKCDFILQEFRPGIEMAVGGWMGPKGFAPGWCENFEFKKLMPGDCGPNTGEMGTVVRVTKQSKLARKVLAPLEQALIQAGVTGYVDVNCIITDDGQAWPLEFTVRPGWPLFNIQQALITGDHALWMKKILDGQTTNPWQMETVAVGMVLAIPDFPYSHSTNKEVSGIPVYGLKLSADFHPCEVKVGNAPAQVKGKILDVPMLVTAGDYVAVVTGTGKGVQEAAKAAQRNLKKLSMPSSPIYRNDIGLRLKKELPKLQAMGYATGLNW